MKRLYFTISLIIISIAVSAQETKQSAPETKQQSYHFGVKLAPSIAWLRSDSKGYTSDGSIFGFSYGLITDFNFANRYAFSTGLDITSRGGKFKTVEEYKTVLNEDSIISSSSTYKLQYIEIPVTLKLKTDEIGIITYYVQLGLAPGINIRARESFESAIQRTVAGTVYNTSSEESNIDVSSKINSFNLSMIIGLGFEYTVSGSTAFVGGIQFNNGFLDAFDNDAKVSSNYLALTLGVLF